MSKDRFNQTIAFKVLSDLLVMIHPIMPFITDDIYLKMHKETITTVK
jgi:valyl-tRNA synthetase